MRRIAISDIHGCNITLGALLEKIELSREDELYFLGDYVDRGRDSKGVIDRIWQLMDDGYQVQCLIGNHEQMMVYSLLEEEWKKSWTLNGGLNTLHSFGVSGPLEIPENYIEFLADLPFYLEVEEYILVHAGLNFKEEDPLSDELSMIWIRNWYGDIDYQWLDGRKIVHGHTPIPRDLIELQVQAMDKMGVVNIDAGCVFNAGSRKLGFLSAFDMTNRRLYLQKNIETEVFG